MIKNIFIPSFKTLEDGIKFMEDAQFKTSFSVGVNWDIWYNSNGEIVSDIEEQRGSVIISHILPDNIITQSVDFENDKWYYDGDYIFIMI